MLEMTLKIIRSIVFTVLLLQVHTINSLRILGLFPVQASSHFVMFKGLLKTLAERGHQVDVYSPFPLEKSIPNYTDVSLAGYLPKFMNNLGYDFVINSTGTFSVKKVIDMSGNPSCKLLYLPMFQELLKDPPTDPPYDLVIVEIFFSNCYLAWGRHLKIPMVGITTQPLFDWLHESLGNPVNIAIDPSNFLEAVAPMTFYERLKNVLMVYWMKYSFNYYIYDQNVPVQDLFVPHMPDVVELQKDLSLVLVNYHMAINGIKSFTPAVVPVGGLHIYDTDDELSQEVQKFLDESENGFVYISFGSMIKLETFPKSILDAFYYTFKKLAPVRVLLKTTEPNNLPHGLPSNVMTLSWLPQLEVLKHKNIKCFVTQGGLMVTQESIYFGVPMVVIPLFGDQHYNIQTFVAKNLAVKVKLDEITGETLYGAINKVTTNPIYKTAAEKIGSMFRDVPMSPIDTSIFWIEYVARHGKDSLRAPIVDMPWYQTSLLDVYAFIIVTTLIMPRIIKSIVGILTVLVSRKLEDTTKSKVKNN